MQCFSLTTWDLKARARIRVIRPNKGIGTMWILLLNPAVLRLRQNGSNSFFKSDYLILIINSFIVVQGIKALLLLSVKNMKYQFSKLVDKYNKVYILQSKFYNKKIIEQNIDYSLLGVGVHPNGSITILLNGNKIAIPEIDFITLSKKLDISISDLSVHLNAVPYTKEDNDLRLNRKKERREKQQSQKELKKKAINEHKEKIKNGEKSYIPVKYWAEYNEGILKTKITKEENIVFKNLRKKDKSKAVKQKHFRINGRSYFADIYIPNKKIVIEVDGGYHETRKEKDKLRDADFASIGIRTIRIPNEAIYDNSFHKYMKQIRM